MRSSEAVISMLADRYTLGRLANQSAVLSNGSGTPSKLPGTPFGRVHGPVGLTQRRVCGLAGRGEVDADADRDRDQVPMDEMRLAQRRPDPPGQPVQSGGVDPGSSDCELVPAQPGHRVLRPDVRAEPMPDGEQGLVARLVTVGVVDLLEPVHVQ